MQNKKSKQHDPMNDPENSRALAHTGHITAKMIFHHSMSACFGNYNFRR
jgi:hypothetical protein